MSNTLITGASSGIGADMARVFATNGHNLILVARSIDKMEALASQLTEQFGIKVTVIGQDLSQPGSALELYQKVQEKGLKVSQLVNNAGLGNIGLYHEIPWQKTQTLLQVNLMTLAELCYVFIPDLLKEQDPGILNVASTAAFQPGPFMSTYFASKSFVLHFSEGLFAEYKGQIRVTSLCPGPTESQFFDVAKTDNSTFFKNTPKMKSLIVAQVAYKGFIQGKAVIVPGFMNWLSSWTVAFVPRALVRWGLARLMR